jgi:molybdopterin converting factor small subunit
MTIQIKLFGDLRKKAQAEVPTGGSPIILTIDDPTLERISDILRKLRIEETEVSHIFVNGKYSGFRKKIHPNDIISFFPKNMGLLYKWYFHRDEDE